jgi:hypothetical protein
MGFSVDKRLKMDKPLGTTYLTTEPWPIKITNTAPSETTRADEIAIETAKTGKVTAVVVVIAFLVKKDASCKVLIAKMKSLLAKRWKESIF